MNVNVLTESSTVLTYLKPLNMHQKKRRNCSNCLQGMQAHTSSLQHTNAHTLSLLRVFAVPDPFPERDLQLTCVIQTMPFLLLFFLLFPHALLVRGKSLYQRSETVCPLSNSPHYCSHIHNDHMMSFKILTHSNWGNSLAAGH